jgi:hypothetical protein
MSILLGVIVLFAVLSLIVAVMQAVAFIRLAPAGAQLGAFMPLGWWKFRRLRAKAGTAAEQPLKAYMRAVIAFLVFIALGLIVSGWALVQAPTADMAATSHPINDWRVIPAQFAFNIDHRRVATGPGAPKMLES